MNYALAVAEAGADVAIVDMDLAAAQATAERLAAETGRTFIAVQADVTDPASVDAMMRRFWRSLVVWMPHSATQASASTFRPKR